MKITFYLLLILAAACGYLCSSLNAAIIMSKLVYKKDIRNLGSGNPGFTNFCRVFGTNAVAVSVFIIDMLKAIIPVAIFAHVFGTAYGMRQFGAAFTGLFCMIGHCFPLYYGFKGGKAYVTGATIIFIIDWRIGLICWAVFLIILFGIKYMSLASCVFALLVPILLAVMDKPMIGTEICSILATILLIWRHKGNLQRLFRGEEKKFSFHKKGTEA